MCLVRLLPRCRAACASILSLASLLCCRYKIAFIVVGLAGQYFTRCVPAPCGSSRLGPADARQHRGLYTDSEVTYARRLKAGCPCCGGRLKPVNEEAHGDATKTG